MPLSLARNRRLLITAVALVAAIGVSLGLHRAQAAPRTPQQQQAQQQPLAPEFPAGMQWLNTDHPVTLKELRGKVVLLDFWTYGCINCIHIMPTLKALEHKYPNELAVIGIHSAKFLSEKDTDNIRDAVLRYDLEHPVLVDHDFTVWNLYGVNAWPTLFLIDPTGHVVGYQGGEVPFSELDAAIGKVVRQFDSQGLLDKKPLTWSLEKDRGPRSVLSFPGKITSDDTGKQLFFTDSDHNRVVIADPDGTVRDVIGDGSVGLKDGDFSTAEFYRPQGLSFDAARNALYVADTENHAIRKIDLAAKKVTTLAGTGKQAQTSSPRGGSGTSVALSSPWDVLVRGDTLYIAMAGCHQLWTLNLKSLVAEKWAGSSEEGLLDGLPLDADLAQPSGLATDGKLLYFADPESSTVRDVPLSGEGNVETLIGTPIRSPESKALFDSGDKDGKYPDARLQHALGVTFHDGFVYAADTYNNKIKKINPRTKDSETYIGTGSRGMADGPAAAATLNEPAGLDWVGDKLYITDTDNNLIRVYDPGANRLSTLKLTGLDKLASGRMPVFHGKEIKADQQSISPDAKTLDVAINLPSGTKFNVEAPFHVTATSDNPNAVTVGAIIDAKAGPMVSVPIVAKAGEATVTVEVDVSYCSTGNTGLCYFKELRAVVPLKVAADGKASASVAIAP